MPAEHLCNLMGNHACALAAVAAGCRFFAGYPITPSTEVAEKMAEELPLVGGTFIQMEDELASMAAVLGASVGGVKAMTATSGPGFSLKQEHIGLAAGAEIPCVVINVMRGGPSTGMPTRPAQGDLMQARWGSHGDNPLVTLTPASVSEIFSQTVRAFNLAEQYRVPVVVLYDQAIGHLTETVLLPDPASLELVDRGWAECAPDFQPYADPGDGVPLMARPGDGLCAHMTGLTHGEDGFPSQDPEVVERVMKRLLGKLERHRSRIESWQANECADAEIVIVALGVVARAARRALAQARAGGIRAGLFRPLTLWPFPAAALADATSKARTVLVAEMNHGQLICEVERLAPPGVRVVGLDRYDGQPITPAQIFFQLTELTEPPRGSSR